MLLNPPIARTARLSPAVRRAALVVAAELAATVLAWAVLRLFELHEAPLPMLLLAWGACFVLYTAPVQSRLARHAGSNGHRVNLVLTGTAVWLATTTTQLPSIYPIMIAALAVETAQRDASTRTAVVALAMMFAGSGAAQLAVHQGWVSSIVAPVPADHLAVVLLTVGVVFLVRGVAAARTVASTRAALLQEQRLRHAELQYAATHDSLTGLLSRRGMEPELTAASVAARPGRGIALIYLDLDGFKAVNDAHGHAVGDELLAAAARRFADALGPEAALARMGGDEFVAVVRELPSPAVAARRVRQVQAALDEPFRLASQLDLEVRVRVGVSVGMAWTDVPTGVDTLMRDADRAMYRDKRLRRRVARVNDSVSA